MHGFVFVPISVLLYIFLYKIKKINLSFTIIFNFGDTGNFFRNVFPIVNKLGEFYEVK